MDDEIVSEFLAESRELLESVDRELVALEREPHSQALVASIFRAVHTMKGTAVCLGFSRFAWIAHNGESVLGRLRDGELVMDADIAGALLEMVDVLRLILDHVEASRNEGPDAFADVVAHLETFAKRPAGAVAQSITDSPSQSIQNARATMSAVAAVRRTDNTLRVDKRVLDRALGLSSELVDLVRLVEEHAPARRSAPLADAIARLDRVAAGLTDTLRRTRMQPVGNLWIGFPRVVRDLAHECGKRARLETEGASVELDRGLLEAIKDPLTHLIRNAVDHGIEDPAARGARGKEPAGLITVGASRENGELVISVSDDGGGVDLDRVRKRAVEKGLLSPAQLNKTDDASVLQMVFAPGFSTAARVTQVSGRGVGLDVVKTNVEAAGGYVEIVTRRHLGTSVRLRFPDARRAAEVRPARRG